VLQNLWSFQERVPVREAHYTLSLPRGWECKTAFLNAEEVNPIQSENQWRWSVRDVPALKPEEGMPAWDAIASQMIVSYFPTEGSMHRKTFSNWSQMGSWYSELVRGRSDPTPEIQEKTTALSSGAITSLDKIRAIARFLQKEIRYVGIQIGIGAGSRTQPKRFSFIATGTARIKSLS